MKIQEQRTFKLYCKLNAKVERINYFNKKPKTKTMYQLPSVSNDLTKSQIKIMSEHIIAELKENGRIIDSADALAKMELLIKEIKSSREWIDYLRDEVSKYGKEVRTTSGTKIELAEVGVKYDYSQCNDDILNQLNAQLEMLESNIKERQTFLKTISPSGIDIIDEFGEVKKIYPPSKTSTSSVKTTIQK